MQQTHPKGLYLLFVTEMAERFSYYGMRALFVLYLVAAFYDSAKASQIYGSYTGLVYLTPLLGGYIADRYWGNRRSIITGGIIMAIGQFMMFLSACFVHQSIATEGGAIDSNVDNSLALWLMFGGLAALIMGNGFFKPNISTMVGDLYDAEDRRRDSAFTIFYMGINVGAFIAPLICGPLGNGNWADPSAFKWGFFAAGCAMVLSVAVFTLLKNRYLVTPEGIDIGLPPAKDKLRKLQQLDEEEHEALLEGKELQATDVHFPKRVAKNSLWRTVLCAMLFVGLLAAFGASAQDINDYISAAIYACSVALPVFIITDRTLTPTDKSRIGVIYIIAVFVIFFWSAFEQAGSSLTIIADRQCNRHIGAWEMPTTWFQSINPIVVVTFAPVMAMMWEWLLKRGINVPSTVKQALGLFLLAIGYLIIAIGTMGIDSATKISMWWLVVLYFIHTMGELSLSPIGLSLVTKLSPAHLASLLMGVWFMSNATANILAGQFATLLPVEGKAPASICGIEITTLSEFFLFFAITAGAAATILLALCPILKRMMK